MDMDMSSFNEIQPIARQIQADALEDQDDAVAKPRPMDELDQAKELAPDEAVLAEEEGPPEYHHDADGKTWRRIGEDYYCVSDPADWTEEDWQEYDPVASARLAQRTFVQFSRHHYRVSPEQLAERRRRWDAKRAERARDESARARGDRACRFRPEPTPAPRPRAVRPRRSRTRSHATADPAPPPEPALAPTATAAVSDPGPAGQPPRAVAVLARPTKSSDQSTPGSRKGSSDCMAGTSQALQPDAGGRPPSAPRKSLRSGPTPPLDQRLRPFVNALADLLFTDLLKYPPKP